MQASKASDADLTSMERLFQTCKQGLFGVLFVMSNDTSESKYRAWFIKLFHMLQVCGTDRCRVTCCCFAARPP